MSQNVGAAIATLKKQFKFQDRWGNFINGEWKKPVKGNYFLNTSPINNEPIAEFA